MKVLDPIARHLPPSWLTEAQLLRLRPIPDALWSATLARYPFLTWRSAAAVHRLRRLATVFLGRKVFTAAGGLDMVTDEMAVDIAAQACLPIIRLGLPAYQGLGSIVVHPGQVVAKRQTMDDSGVVHAYDEVLAGEAMPGGPVMLSWEDVTQAQDVAQGYNVVVHEFAHALDALSGEVDGTPPLPSDISAAQWQDVLWQAFDRHSEAQARGETPWLDPYATHDGLVEFFPVVCEAFFAAPNGLQAAHPEVYGLLARYFAEDPAHWAAAAAGGTPA